MTKKTKAKSRIFEAVHETASDLHRLGFFDGRKMRKVDALCLDSALEVTVGLDDESAALLRSLARTRRTKPEKLVSLVVQYWLEDEADIRAARHSRKASAGRPNVSLDEVKKRLGLED